MPRYSYHQGVLDLEETQDMHMAISRDYSEIIGRHRTDIQFDDEINSINNTRIAVLGKLALKLKESLPEFSNFHSEQWRATINQWSSARFVGEQRLRPHRDRVGCAVAVTSLHGIGKFCIGRNTFEVNPGDVVVMQNKWLPPKHSVDVITDERMSVAMWNAFR